MVATAVSKTAAFNEHAGSSPAKDTNFWLYTATKQKYQHTVFDFLFKKVGV